MEQFLTQQDSVLHMQMIILILGWSVRAIEEVITQIKEAAISTGLVIYETKTKYTKINRNIANLEQYLIMDGQVFERVQNFRCFGTLMNSENLM
jgi:hypothetical protein